MLLQIQSCETVILQLVTFNMTEQTTGAQESKSFGLRLRAAYLRNLYEVQNTSGGSPQWEMSGRPSFLIASLMRSQPKDVAAFLKNPGCSTVLSLYRERPLTCSLF